MIHFLEFIGAYLLGGMGTFAIWCRLGEYQYAKRGTQLGDTYCIDSGFYVRELIAPTDYWWSASSAKAASLLGWPIVLLICIFCRTFISAVSLFSKTLDLLTPTPKYSIFTDQQNAPDKFMIAALNEVNEIVPLTIEGQL